MYWYVPVSAIRKHYNICDVQHCMACLGLLSHQGSSSPGLQEALAGLTLRAWKLKGSLIVLKPEVHWQTDNHSIVIPLALKTHTSLLPVRIYNVNDSRCTQLTCCYGCHIPSPKQQARYYRITAAIHARTSACVQAVSVLTKEFELVCDGMQVCSCHSFLPIP